MKSNKLAQVISNEMNKKADSSPEKKEEQIEEVAECAWCHDEYPISDLKKEKDLGYLCDQCIRAIESKEGGLTFEDEEW